MEEKKKWVAFLLALFFGYWGVHRFYTGHIGLGIAYLFTFGFLGVGTVIDLITILIGSYRDISGKTLVE